MKQTEQIRISIVVPIHDEQENIAPLYMKLTDVLESIAQPYEIIFVDDGSRDQSFHVLEEIHEHDHRVHLLRLRRNFGQTAALKAGFDFALGEVVITIDADLQNDPADIPLLLEKLDEGFDIVSGWRKNRKEPWLTRRVPSMAANAIMSRLTRVPLHDFGATLKAYRREVIADLPLYGELHRFIPALASWSGARIAEVVIRDHPRHAGRSKYGLSRTSRVLLDFLSVKFLLDYSTKPLQFFGLFGLAGLGMGAAINLFLLYKKIVAHSTLMVEHGPLMLLGIALVISGMQFLSLGLLGEMMSRTYYESQQKPIYALRDVRSKREVPAESGVRDADSSRS